MAADIYREHRTLLRLPSSSARASREGIERGGKGKTARIGRERHKTKEERERGDDDGEKTAECTRKREGGRERERGDAHGAKIRMSVGMPLDGSGVYRVIQRERERKSEDMRG